MRSTTISASAATSRRPRLSPCPASGCTTWAASAISARRSPTKRRAKRKLNGNASTREARWIAPSFRVKRCSSCAQEILGRERQQRLGVGVALVPDDARLAPAHRQDGERAGGQEVLLGAAVVIALVARSSRRCRTGRCPSRRSGFRRARAAWSARRPRATTRRARNASPPESSIRAASPAGSEARHRARDRLDAERSGASERAPRRRRR